jgi:hypothetical protein
MFIYLHPHSRKENDLVAQLVEHITFNDGVLGSSPSQVTKKHYFLESYDLVAQLVEHITFNDGVLGSSPSQVTKIKSSYMLDFFYLWLRGEIGRLATLRW